MRLLELGRRFGMLEVIEHAYPIYRRNGRPVAASICRCDCGTVSTIKNNTLLSGLAASCGCAKTVHGDARGTKRPPEYIAWRNMKSRCENPNDKDYVRYGWRGIRVCQAWSESYTAFLDDMGRRPDGWSIDRIDPNGDYEPANCRWADKWTQAQNKRWAINVRFREEEMGLAEACRRAGIEAKYVTIHARVTRYGMTFEQAMAREGIPTT